MIPGVVADLLILILTVYYYLIIANAVVSWIPAIPRSHPVVRFLYQVTEPALRPFRRLIPPGKTAFIDISPLLAIFAIIFLTRIIDSMRVSGIG